MLYQRTRVKANGKIEIISKFNYDNNGLLILQENIESENGILTFHDIQEYEYPQSLSKIIQRRDATNYKLNRKEVTLSDYDFTKEKNAILLRSILKLHMNRWTETYSYYYHSARLFKIIRDSTITCDNLKNVTFIKDPLEFDDDFLINIYRN